MKKLITMAILSSLAFNANAKSFHANLICQDSRVVYQLSSTNQSTMEVDGVPYFNSKESVSIPNLGGTDTVTMLRAANQSGKEAEIIYTQQSLKENKLWLIIGSGPDKPCYVVNSWEGE